MFSFTHEDKSLVVTFNNGSEEYQTRVFLEDISLTYIHTLEEFEKAMRSGLEKKDGWDYDISLCRLTHNSLPFMIELVFTHSENHCLREEVKRLKEDVKRLNQRNKELLEMIIERR